ncbi:MAG: PAS domain-containing protein [Hyphomonadaceae bacterium]|nr:PAS domain-containing protein [Hyphomonadaceae bacterium]
MQPEHAHKAAALDLLPIAVVLTDRALRLLDANAAAATMLERGDGLLAAAGRLECRLREDKGPLLAAITNAIAGARPSARALVRISRTRGRPYLALALAAPLCADPFCLVLVADPSKRQETEAFAAMFDLSEQELDNVETALTQPGGAGAAAPLARTRDR